MTLDTKGATLAEWLHWQHTLNKKPIDLGLERVAAVAERCRLLPIRCPVITVAGTNGKGSTVTFIDSVLRHCGYRVGSYTSPHLHQYNERIRINGEVADDEAICRAFERIEAHREDRRLTFFEYGTLAALKCFLNAQVDVMVLEVGLGGRLDAVNIVDPSVCVVTNIDYDHTQWLGHDRESIAREKLGIARADTPLVSGDVDPPKVIATRAAQLGAPLYQYGEDFRHESDGAEWRFVSPEREMRLPLPGLFGDMQMRNAACAIMALHLMRHTFDIQDEDFAAGIRDARMPGRFQRARGGRDIYDIAHNAQGARELRRNLRKGVTGGRLHAVFGALKDKDVAGIIEGVKDEVHHWYLSAPNNERALRRDDLLAVARAAGLSDFQVYDSVAQAYDAAGERMGEDDTRLVFGSVFVVAEAQARAAGDDNASGLV